MATQARKQTSKPKQLTPLTRSITIRGVPTDIVDRLKERAKRNHRSLQGEMVAILEQNAGTLTVDEVVERIKKLNFSTPSESTQWIREDRDAR